MKSQEITTPVSRADLPTFAEHLPITQTAIRFARHLHRHQRRASDGAQFIVHPLEVAALLYNVGCPDRIVAAGVLHDVIEDTSTVIEEIRQRFGVQIAGLVGALTEDARIVEPRTRKAALRDQVREAGAQAATIFAADKLTKVRELRTMISHPEPDEPLSAAFDEKREHYVASLVMLEQLIPDSPLTRQLRFELEVLHTLPPREAGSQTRGATTRRAGPSSG